ncbi:XrtA/PEP-CTERM system TPR-repeat protein PrsT [Alteromonas gracilis]|uniref:XrtA/PEP-CTERM system TPR-repeat protein PrsT n=1 Tax=Alteromonas gracilis TaxID=1479524 RepID=UPI00142E4946|nr:XrtA/PEP-CTERM system TPR-repeat protein PrsT [Alteromonas gracilis]
MKTYSKLSVVSLFCFLSACGNNSPEKMMADAKSMLESGQLQEASVTLKNVIQNNPSLLEAREMLGMIYLNQGLYLASQKELQRAENVLSDQGKIALAETYLWLEEFDSVQELEIQADGTDKDELKLYQAIALFRSDQPANAAKFMSELESSSSLTVASVARAYSHTLNEEPQLALQAMDGTIDDLASSPLALQLKFTLENFLNNWPNAIATSKQLLSLRPADYKIKTQLATVLINDGKFEEAKPIVEQLLQLSADQAYFNQLKGTILLSEKDFEGATLHLDKAIKNGRSNQVTRLFSAIAHYQLGNFEQAYQNLSSIINTLPKDHYAKRLYTTIQLRLGYTQDGVNSINSMSDLGQDDLLYIVETSRLLIQRNELSQAKQLVNKINSEEIADAKMLQNIGLLKLLTGDSGISELERNLDASSDTEDSFYLLLVAYVENKLYDKAYELIDTRFTGEQNTIQRLKSTGFVQQTSGDMNAANKTYEKLREIKPDNFDAMLFFVEQSIKNANLSNAASQLNRAIELYPLSTRLLMRSFQVHQRIGDLAPAISQLENAQSSSDEPRYALLYAAALLLNEQYKGVVDYLKEKQQLLEAIPKYWMLLGDAYLKQANYNDARKAFAEWRKQEPAVSSYTQSIQLEEIEGNYLQAEQLISEAKRKLGTNTTFDLLAGRLKLLQGKNKEASVIYGRLPETAKQSLAGQLIKGRLAFAKGNYKAALEIIEPQYNKAPSRELALLVFSSLVKLEQHERVINFTEAHLANVPSDAKVRLLFANYLLEKEPKRAIEQYAFLVQNEKTDSPLVLNNLAWLLTKEGSPSEALNYIEKADTLVPNNPNILSTYGAVLSSLSQHERAIEKSKSAFLLSDENANIALEYVHVLALGGRKTEAKQVASTIIPVTAAQELQLNELKKQHQLQD